MTALQSRLQESLRSRAERQILRSLDPATLVSASSSTHPLVDFSSNDYLSLARSNVLRSRLLDALSSLPSPYGPPSSRLLDGNSSIHLDLERQLQVFFKSEAALLFNSGFDANVGLWTCLPSPNDYILYDALIHASTHDGMRSSRIPVWNRRSFKHNDVEDLRGTLHQLLAEDEGVRAGNKSVWIAVETLYSMDGDLSPLASIVEAVEQILHRGNGHFVVDEVNLGTFCHLRTLADLGISQAHSTGLYGEQGRGIVSALGLEDRIEVRVHTFGKSMACSGGAHYSICSLRMVLTRIMPAVVLCKSLLRSYLINYARPLIYSTVMPHMNVLAISNSFKMLSDGHGDEVR